jgi:hypothetical protein
METDIGNPIDYDPHNDPFTEKKEKEEDSTPIMYQQEQSVHEQPFYYNPSESLYPPQNYHLEQGKGDFLSNVDKSVWIIAFAVFLLGFFMGKTMQPVILRYA